MSKVAFLGIGRMGRPMAARLLAAGHDLSVWNRAAEKARPLIEAGAKLAASPAEAAREAEFAIAMLADDGASRRAWLGPDGALAGLAPGAMAIECSTLSAQCVAELAAAAKARNIAFVDCPVTGLPQAAAEGALTLLVGAAPGDLTRARPVLEAFGATLRHFGPVGAGTAYKLVINLMGAVQILGLAEGLRALERLGLEREAVIAAIEASAAASPQVKRHARRMARRNYSADLAFTNSLRHKDADYAMRLLRSIGYSPALGAAATDAFARAMAADPQADEASVIETL